MSTVVTLNTLYQKIENLEKILGRMINDGVNYSSEIISFSKARKMLGMTETQLNNLINNNRIPAIILENGRKKLVKEDVEKYLEKIKNEDKIKPMKETEVFNPKKFVEQFHKQNKRGAK